MTYWTTLDVFVLSERLQLQSADDENTKDTDASGPVVHEEDFYTALSHLVPSLSAAEQKRYESLQEMFSQRRCGNQYTQQWQQPVTDSASTDFDL